MQCYSLGLLGHPACALLMENVHRHVSEGHWPATVLLVEHPSVITQGLHASDQDILISAAELSRLQIQVVRTDRGGQVTAHMPGQLVVYPILNLSSISMGVRSYVEALEQTCIHYLTYRGIPAFRKTGCPGIYTAHGKIGSVGIRVKNKTSKHGIALNLHHNLEIFRTIRPCGSLEPISSIEEISGVRLCLEKEFEVFMHSFSEIFRTTAVIMSSKEDLIARLNAPSTEG